MTIKEQNKSNRTAGIFIVIMTAVFILLIQNTAEAQQSATMRVIKKEQKYYSFDRWRDEQPKVRIQQVKYAVEVSKENNKDSKANQRLNKKIEAIRSRIK